MAPRKLSINWRNIQQDESSHACVAAPRRTTCTGFARVLRENYRFET